MGVHQHRAKGTTRAGCAVLTISDTRTEADDESGARMRQLITGAGHEAGLAFEQALAENRTKSDGHGASEFPKTRATTGFSRLAAFYQANAL